MKVDTYSPSYLITEEQAVRARIMLTLIPLSIVSLLETLNLAVPRFRTVDYHVTLGALGWIETYPYD